MEKSALGHASTGRDFCCRRPRETLLGKEIAPDSNFFEIGGTSLSVFTVVNPWGDGTAGVDDNEPYTQQQTFNSQGRLSDTGTG